MKVLSYLFKGLPYHVLYLAFLLFVFTGSMGSGIDTVLQNANPYLGLAWGMSLFIPFVTLAIINDSELKKKSDGVPLSRVQIVVRIIAQGIFCIGAIITVYLGITTDAFSASYSVLKQACGGTASVLLICIVIVAVIMVLIDKIDALKEKRNGK